MTLIYYFFFSKLDNGTDSNCPGILVGFAISNFSSWNALQETHEAQMVQVVYESKVLFGKKLDITNTQKVLGDTSKLLLEK